MVAEMDIFFKILIEDCEYKEMEDNLVWLLNHQAISVEQKIGYACRIPSIDQFYNPYTKIEKVFEMVMGFYQGNPRPPYRDDVVDVARRVLAFLERQNWKKDINSALNAFTTNSKASIDEFQRYMRNALPASEIIFATNPGEVLFGGN